MILELKGIDVDCIIGDLPDERSSPQRVVVDVALLIGDDAATSDMLVDTVDYAALSDQVRTALVSAKCRMIERAAKVVCDQCRADPKVHGARVKVTKAGVVAHLASASAVYADGFERDPIC